MRVRTTARILPDYFDWAKRLTQEFVHQARHRNRSHWHAFCEQSGLRSLQGDLHVADVIWKGRRWKLRIVGGLAGLQVGCTSYTVLVAYTPCWWYWGGPLLGVQKATAFTAPKMRLLQ